MAAKKRAAPKAKQPTERQLRIKHAKEEAQELLSLAKERCDMRRNDAKTIVKAAEVQLAEAKADLIDTHKSCTLEMSAAKTEAKAHVAFASRIKRSKS